MSLGVHPAFNWPLQAGLPKENYALTFTHEEPSPICRVEGGLLLAAADPCPVRDTVLPLSEALFTDDAVILNPVNRAAVRYADEQGTGPWLKMSWRGFRNHRGRRSFASSPGAAMSAPSALTASSSTSQG